MKFARDSPLEGGGFELPVPRGRPALNNTPRPNECRYCRRSDRDSGVSHLAYRNWEPMVRIHLPPAGSRVRTSFPRRSARARPLPEPAEPGEQMTTNRRGKTLPVIEPLIVAIGKALLLQGPFEIPI